LVCFEGPQPDFQGIDSLALLVLFLNIIQDFQVQQGHILIIGGDAALIGPEIRVQACDSRTYPILKDKSGMFES
jgi:hypothetical protein